MSGREQAAACPLAAGELPLLALHRHVPERTLPDLLAASARIGDAVRIALFHWQACLACAQEALVGSGRLCERGARLIEPARGWRARA